MRWRKGDCKIPGTRREGEVKRMRREGAGRMRRYCGGFAVSAGVGVVKRVRAVDLRVGRRLPACR